MQLELWLSKEMQSKNYGASTTIGRLPTRQHMLVGCSALHSEPKELEAKPEWTCNLILVQHPHPWGIRDISNVWMDYDISECCECPERWPSLNAYWWAPDTTFPCVLIHMLHVTYIFPQVLYLKRLLDILPPRYYLLLQRAIILSLTRIIYLAPLLIQ